MSWTADWMMPTGLTQDVATEHMLPSSDLTLSGGLLQFPMNVNGKNCVGLFSISSIGGTFTNGNIYAASGEISISANPSAEIGLITNGVQGSTVRPLRIGTDGKIKFYGPTGTLLASSTSPVSTNPASPTVYVAFWDFLSLSTIWLSLFVNSGGGGAMVEEVALNTGINYSSAPWSGYTFAYSRFGDYLPAGSNYGATMQGRFFLMRETSSVADAPYNAAYPLLKGLGAAVPTSEGTYHAWTTATPATTPNTWQDVDERPNDGGTSFIGDSQTADPKTRHKHTFLGSAANPFSGGETIVFAQFKHVGEITGASKNYANILVVLAGSELDVAPLIAPTTSYLANGAMSPTTPAGGAWATSDWAPNTIEVGGYSNVTAGINTAPAWTTVSGAEAIYYTASLPLATTPSTPARRRFASII